jgi:uncharacterized protein involved in outer membrane biogenesis
LLLIGRKEGLPVAAETAGSADGGSPRGWGRTVIRALVAILALVLVGVLIVSFVRIPIGLNDYRGVVESATASAIGRDVTVEGDVTVTTSLWPYFEIEALTIANPDGFEPGSFARLERAQISVALIPLLFGKLHIVELYVGGLSLDLTRSSSGAVNWALGSSTVPMAGAAESVEGDDSGDEIAADALAVDTLTLENIAVRYRDQEDGTDVEMVVHECTGTAAVGEPMKLDMHGVWSDEPFELDVSASSLGEFLAMTRSRLDIEFEIAATHFEFSGSSDVLGAARTIDVELAVFGARLDSMNDLLNVDLPPLTNYRLAAHLMAQPGRAALENVEVTVEDSSLRGSVVIDRTGAKPAGSVTLVADSIQLDDFDVGAWSPEARQESADREEAPGAEPARAGILSAEMLARANLQLSVDVEQVQSGQDALGRGEVRLSVQDGRLSLDPLRIAVPGGEVLIQASVKPGRVASDGSLRILVKDFDFGLLAHRLDPETDLGGKFNVDVDLNVTTATVGGLLAHANGYFDMSGTPQNFAAGIVDLWAVNLISSVVSSSVEDEAESQINCVISRWRMVDGVLIAENVAVDTTKIRICGKGSIDFTTRTFNLTAAPTAKRPEFFSLATPLVITGKFDDFGIGLRGGVIGAGTTAVKFAISPITTPFKRLVHDDLPDDGADICNLPIGPRSGPADGELEALAGC